MMRLDSRSLIIVIGFVAFTSLLGGCDDRATGNPTNASTAPEDWQRELAVMLDELTDDRIYTDEQRAIFWKKHEGSKLSLRGSLRAIERYSVELSIDGYVAAGELQYGIEGGVKRSRHKTLHCHNSINAAGGNG